METGEFISLGLAILGLGLVIFSLGAQAGWLWAVKSLRATPPRWIPAVTAVGALAFVTSAAIRADWLTVVSGVVFWGLIVAGQLRIGPWFRRSGGNQPT